MIVRIARKLHGAALIALQLREQKRIPFLPREIINALRDRNIRSMVQYAVKTVPYYQEYFARHGARANQIRGAEDLDRLPPIDKETVRSQPDRFTARSSSSRDALTVRTSGSTGKPLEALHDRRSVVLNIPYGERERQTIVEGCGGGFRPKEIYVGYDSSVMKQVTAFYDEIALLPVRPRRRFVSLTKPIEEIAAIINAEQPDILVGYGGWVDLCFKTVSARGVELHRPKMVMYVGEALPHGAREHIETNFGISVISRYCAAEAFKIGYFCERASGFHIHEDLCHVRIVDTDGRTLPPGEQGEIVISNLVNRASVFLNYRIGDLGALSPEKCACGRTFKLLSELEGRVEDILSLNDGRFVHPRAFWEVFKLDKRVLQYQLTQQDASRFALSLATVNEEEFRQAFAAALPKLKSLLGADAEIEASRRTEDDRPEGRKFRAVVSKRRDATGNGSL